MKFNNFVLTLSLLLTLLAVIVLLLTGCTQTKYEETKQWTLAKNIPNNEIQEKTDKQKERENKIACIKLQPECKKK
jgi:outer membrane biogenesis lipoprotein LolB